jgi:hypothetical protein
MKYFNHLEKYVYIYDKKMFDIGTKIWITTFSEKNIGRYIYSMIVFAMVK